MGVQLKVKEILFLMLLAASTTVFAKVINVADEHFPSHMEDARLMASLQVDKDNQQSDRAWVEITFQKSSFSGDMPDEFKTVRKAVPGLQFNAKTSEVTYQEAGKSPVVCATFVPSHFFVDAHMKATGQCELIVKKLEASSADIRTKSDDGFVVRYSPVARVTLNIKD